MKHLKRLFPVSLAFLLVMGGLGNVFAAAFCPRLPGHDCCRTMTAGVPHSKVHQHMQGMPMDAMANESLSLYGSNLADMTMATADVSLSAFAGDEITATSAPEEELAAANQVELPIAGCSHCASHSGIQNAPTASVRLPDQSKKDPGSVLLPVTRFFARPALSLAQVGLPREHAPPQSSAPRYILISVFLI